MLVYQRVALEPHPLRNKSSISPIENQGARVFEQVLWPELPGLLQSIWSFTPEMKGLNFPPIHQDAFMYFYVFVFRKNIEPKLTLDDSRNILVNTPAGMRITQPWWINKKLVWANLGYAKKMMADTKNIQAISGSQVVSNLDVQSQFVLADHWVGTPHIISSFIPCSYKCPFMEIGRNGSVLVPK